MTDTDTDTVNPHRCLTRTEITVRFSMNDWPVTKTSDVRVRVANCGPQNWRTVVRDAASGWDITGPSYPTKAEALANVARVCVDYYGDPDPVAPVSEIARLTAVLHAVQAHPDYRYAVTYGPTPQHHPGANPMWELNTDVAAHGSANGTYPVAWYWRLRA